MARIQITVCCTLLLVLFAGITAQADPFRPAFTEKEIDAKASKTWNGPEEEWLSYKLIAFRRPMRIGSPIPERCLLRWPGGTSRTTVAGWRRGRCLTGGFGLPRTSTVSSPNL